MTMDNSQIAFADNVSECITAEGLSMLETQAKYRSLYTHMSQGFAFNRIILTETGDAVDFEILEMNPALASILCLGKLRVIGRKGKEVSEMLNLLTPDFIESVAETAFIGEDKDFQTYCPSLGKWLNIFIHSPFRGYFSAIVEDITALKHMEHGWKESEHSYKTIFENTIDAIMIINQEKRFIEVNPRACKMLGYEIDELKAMTVLDIVTDDIDYIDKKREDIMKKGHLLFETCLKHRNNYFIPVEINSTVISYLNQPAILSVIRDVSERKHLEEELRISNVSLDERVKERTAELAWLNDELLTHQKRLRSLTSEMAMMEERQRRRIAQILHDGIGQSLALCKYHIDFIRTSRDKKEFRKKILEIDDTINAIIKETRSLTFELSPPILYELGLGKALMRLADQILTPHNILVHFENGSEPDTLGGDLRGLLFQSIRELFVNIMKHSKAKNVRVSLGNDSRLYSICVDDDGVGFDQKKYRLKPGNENCFGLFSISEKITYIGGHVDIVTEPGHGTKITLIVPISIDDNQEN
jgi:PAS domain S-box-containing protein